MFLDYFEANELSAYLNNKGLNHEFIDGIMKEEMEKKISLFEHEQSIFISTYDILEGIYFNISNYEKNKFHVILYDFKGIHLCFERHKKIVEIKE